MNQITDTVKHLIIINVIFFVASMVFKEPFYDLFAFHFPENELFKPWQYVSRMFMHGYVFNPSNLESGVMHLVFNMLGLWMFGTTVEQMLGKQRFIFLYFSAGLGAGLISSGIYYIEFNQIYNDLIGSGVNESTINSILKTGNYNTGILNKISKEELSKAYSIYNQMSVGASGALFGVMVAFATLQPRAKLGMMFIPIMLEARFFIPIILSIDLFFGIFRMPGDNIGRFAHLGGALVGFIIIWYWKKNQFKRWN